MRMSRNLFLTSLFFKIVYTFLIVVVPFFILGLFLNESAASNVKAEIVKSMQTKGSFYMYALTSELERVRNLQKQFVNDDDLLKLSVIGSDMKDYDRTASHIRLQQRLLLVKNSSKYIEQAVVYLPLTQTTVSTEPYELDLYAEQYEHLLAAANKATPLVSWNDGLYMLLRYPDAQLSKVPTFLMSLKLSVPNIRNDLIEFSKDSGGAVLFSESVSWKIIADSDSGLGDGIVRWHEQSKAESEQYAAVSSARIQDNTYFILPTYYELFDMSLILYVADQSIFGSLEKFRVLSWVLLVLSIAFIILFSLRIYRILHLPMRRLLSSFRMVQQGNLDVSIKHPGNDEFNYLYEQFNSMIYRLKVLIQENYEQKFRMQRAELKQLQSQTNPHFLYNFFFIMNQMVHLEDYDNLKSFTKHLGHYFQFITRDARDAVPLIEEVMFARAYVEIQTVRYESRIEVIFAELPEELHQLQVPRLIIQPIIENAYKHGFEKTASRGELCVRFLVLDGTLHICVEDNGAGISMEQLMQMGTQFTSSVDNLENTGMINIHHRLKLSFGSKAGIVLAMNASEGLMVTMHIPLEEEPDMG
jgi:two-component system sensor histidine kinase YesM